MEEKKIDVKEGKKVVREDKEKSFFDNIAKYAEKQLDKITESNLGESACTCGECAPGMNPLDYNYRYGNGMMNYTQLPPINLPYVAPYPAAPQPATTITTNFTADGANYIITGAVKDFVKNIDYINGQINDDGKTAAEFSKFSSFINECKRICTDLLVNVVQRHATQPCTDNEVRKLIDDFRNDHEYNERYICKNDGNVDCANEINLHKKNDKLGMQLLIYKLSGLTR